MPNTSSATWPSLLAGNRARASEVEAKFDFSEHHLWPHSAGTAVNNTYDLGNTTAAYWRTAWVNSLNATTTANGVAIGTTTVASNSDVALEIATPRTLLLPRVTTAQRDAFTGINGMLIYNNTAAQFQKYGNGAWRAMGGSAIGLAVDFNTSVTDSIAGATTTTQFLNYSGSGRLRKLIVTTAGSGAGDQAKYFIVPDSITAATVLVDANTAFAVTTSSLYLASAGATLPMDFTGGAVDLLVDIFFKNTLDIYVQRNASGAGTITAQVQMTWEHD